MEIVEYGDEGFTTLETESGRQRRWSRVQTRRYFLSFAARGGPSWQGGIAFAILTKLDGRQTEIEALGVQLTRGGNGKTSPAFGSIPAKSCNEFTNESDKDSDVMMRLELAEAEFERTHKVFETWEKYARDRTLPHRDPYLNGMEFLTSAAESLNQCDEKLKPFKLDGHPVASLDPQQRPLEYIKIIRKENDRLHVTDGEFPTDWRPILLPQGH